MLLRKVIHSNTACTACQQTLQRWLRSHANLDIGPMSAAGEQVPAERCVLEPAHSLSTL